MARVTVEDCLQKVPNRFALVLLATNRTRQLLKGAGPLVEHHKNKPPVLALREIAADRVRFELDLTETLATSVADLKAKHGDPFKKEEDFHASGPRRHL